MAGSVGDDIWDRINIMSRFSISLSRWVSWTFDKAIPVMAEISTEVSFKLLCNVQDYLGTFSLMIIIIIIMRNILGTFSIMIFIIIIIIFIRNILEVQNRITCSIKRLNVHTKTFETQIWYLMSATLKVPSQNKKRGDTTGLPRHRENREFGDSFSQTGKTKGICLKY